MAFNIACLDSVLQGEKRKRVLLLTDNCSDALFIIQQFSSEQCLAVLTKPADMYLEGEIADWYSWSAESRSEVKKDGNVYCMPADPVLFLSALKKIEDVKKIFFHLTPLFFMHERDTIHTLIAHISALCEQRDLELLVLLESDVVEESDIASLRNAFDYVLEMKNGILTLISQKKLLENLEIRYGIGESHALMRTQNGVEKYAVRWAEGQNSYWLPGLDAIFPYGLPQNSSIYFSLEPGKRDYIIEQCASDAISTGKPCIVVTSEFDFNAFSERMKKRSIDINAGNDKPFVFVDWYTSKNRKVNAVEEKGCVLHVARDIVYLSVAIDWALKKVGERGVLILDCVTHAVQNCAFEDVIRFIVMLNTKLRRRNFLLLSIGNPKLISETHDRAIGHMHSIHLSQNGDAIGVVSADATYFKRTKFSFAVAANMLSVISKPVLDADDELSAEELCRVLKKLDELLGNLPDDRIAEFAQSEEFKLYDRLLRKLGI